MPTVRHLGQHSTLPTHYDASLLEAIPRLSTLKEVGYDVWHAYEVCALCDDGLPVQTIAKLCYTRQSEFLVESKSLKLYLYSLANERLGRTPPEVLQRLEQTIVADLSALLHTQVRCNLHTHYNLTADTIPLVGKLRREPPPTTGRTPYCIAALSLFVPSYWATRLGYTRPTLSGRTYPYTLRTPTATSRQTMGTWLS